MEKNKTEVWGVDNDGNFTINGKKTTKKQRQQVCTDLKINLPENYLDLLPELEKRVRNLTPRHPLRLKGNLPENYLELLPWIDTRAQNLPSRRVSTDPFEPFRELAQSATKSLKPKVILRTKGSIKAPPGEEPFSRLQKFVRLVVLQAEWEGISTQQLIDEVLRLSKTSESTGTPAKTPNGQKDTAEDKQKKNQKNENLLSWRECATKSTRKKQNLVSATS